MTRTMISFRVDSELKRKYMSKLALDGKTAQDHLEETIKNYIKEDAMKEQFRIENIQKATLNGRKIKLFNAFEYDNDAKAYVFCGQFAAPQRTPNYKLVNFITEE